MKEDYLDYDNHFVDVGNMVESKSNNKNYKVKQRKIDFTVPLADMLNEKDIEKLKSIR